MAKKLTFILTIFVMSSILLSVVAIALGVDLDSNNNFEKNKLNKQIYLTKKSNIDSNNIKIEKNIASNRQKNSIYNESTHIALLDKNEDLFKKIDFLKLQIEKKLLQNQDKYINKKDNIRSTKMVIIVDDISFEKQVQKINSLNLKLNLSFLPPNEAHIKSAVISKDIDNYLVHLPLEPISSNVIEANTLLTDSSQQQIEKEIKKIKALYPNVKYVNNHMGSRFTADKNSMKKLLTVLKKYNIGFIDSKTTSKTVSTLVAKELDMKILHRDIFFDNKKEIPYIKKQIKKAIKIAKEKGYSISICHPYKETLIALKESKHLFKDIKLVYIDEL